ncbi:hypothetical protein NQ122_30285 [Klebsiella pneumoniae]|nr:hypothetical protein [Klebsiella pneumoniae]
MGQIGASLSLAGSCLFSRLPCITSSEAQQVRFIAVAQGWGSARWSFSGERMLFSRKALANPSPGGRLRLVGAERA